MANSQTLGPTDSHIVSLYVDGQEKAVPTRAETVGDFLNRTNTKLNQNDLVEPSLKSVIDADNYRISVYRAKPMVIVDGGTTIKVLTPYSDKLTIAQKAGLTIYPEDILTLSSPDNFIKSNNLGQALIIDRAVLVMVGLYGAPLVVDRTQATTVGGYLRENNIKVEAGSNLVPAESTPITSGMAIFIAKAGKTVTVVEQPVPFETETSLDASLPLNKINVLTTGKNGRKFVYYESDISGANRKILHEVVIEQPIKQIQVKGIKAPNMTVSGDRITWMRSAGIAEGDFYAVDFVVGHESGWRPNAVSGSGCTGLGQACPGSKLAVACPNWASDPVCQLKFFSGYAANRYGGWQGAYSTWTRQGWW